MIHLDRLTGNLRLLQELAGDCPLWPVIKANAYGHGDVVVARHLTRLGHRTLCVAHAREAAALAGAGVQARFVLMTAMLPQEAADIVAGGFEPAVCTLETTEALAREAARAGTRVNVHLKVDTGMGRVGVRPEEVVPFLERCRALPALTVKGLMSHFPRADEADKTYSEDQIARFREVCAAARGFGIAFRHMANSAALLDLPDARFDAARPGIAMYGLAPSAEIANPRVRELSPVLEWTTRVTFLRRVSAGTGLSYGHAYRTEREALIATIPVGYGDGLHRNLSGAFEVLVGGRRCPQVGRITMDQSLVDVTALGDAVGLGDEVVLIGTQGGASVRADELAGRLGTIHYEVVTAVAERVNRVGVGG